MKEKIMIFLIGFLVGAILTTGVFFAYTLIIQNSIASTPQTEQINGGEQPPEMPDGEKSEMDGETPPEKPSDENTDQSEKSSSNSSEKNHSNSKKSTNDKTENN